jgi:peptidoglycan/xylan/chitin deacetylase (PgdA/CDA1 family)
MSASLLACGGTVRRPGPDPVPSGSGGATTLVSLTFDDALAQQLAAAAILERHGMRGTFFLNTWRLRSGSADNMTPAQAKDLEDRGHEIGGHTIDHVHLTTLTPAQQHVQICNDRAYLTSVGLDVQSFAYPFGEWNAQARQAVVDCGYDSARDISGVDGSVAAESFVPEDRFALRAPRSIASTDTVADIEGWVMRAERQGGWLILTFHHVCDRCAENAIRAEDLENLVAWLEQRRSTGTRTARVRDVIGGTTKPVVTWPQ